MRDAPLPVCVELGDGRAERVVEAALHACAGGVLALWAIARWSEPAGAIAASGWVASAAVTAIAALMSWRLQPARPQRLQWDGRCWRLDDRQRAWVGEPGRASAMMDLGGWMLLRFDSSSPARARWFGVSAGRAGAAWHGLRAALYAAAASKAKSVDLPGGSQ